MLYSPICCYLVKGWHIVGIFEDAGTTSLGPIGTPRLHYGHFHCSLINFLLDSSIPLYISIMPWISHHYPKCPPQTTLRRIRMTPRWLSTKLSLWPSAQTRSSYSVWTTPHPAHGHILTHADDRPAKADRRCCGLLQSSKLALAPLVIARYRGRYCWWKWSDQAARAL